VRFAFIRAHAQDFNLLLMCWVLGVSRSGYYAWLKRPPSERERADQELAQFIRATHQRGRGTSGSPHIHAELKAQGRKVDVNESLA
jgi:putative transposase